MAKSIIQADREHCFICGGNGGYWGLDEHHVFGGFANRKLSEKYGLKVYICHDKCHLNGVHKDEKLNQTLKAAVQKIAMLHYGWTEDQFIKIFGKNYL